MAKCFGDKMKYINLKINKAFTLVELLVVISIIALLSSVVFASISNARQQARLSLKKQQLSILSKAIQQMYLEKGIIPINANTDSFWCAIGTNYTGGTCLSELISNSYVSAYPRSPDSDSYYYYYNSTLGVAMVAARVTPRQYGPSGTQWHCSDVQGGAADKIYCIDAVLR